MDYSNKTPKPQHGAQRKPISRQKKMHLALAIMHLKAVEESELADFVGMTRNNLRYHYNKIYKKNDTKS